VVVDVLLLVGKLPPAVVAGGMLLLVSVLPGYGLLPGRKPCSALPMRTTVTPTGATPSLEACSWVELSLPFMPGETLGPLCWTGQRWRFGVVPFLKALRWLQGLCGSRRWWPRRSSARPGYAMSATTEGVRLRGAMYAIIYTLQSTPLQVQLDPAICLLRAASLGT
jgi:hypothetical protein